MNTERRCNKDEREFKLTTNFEQNPRFTVSPGIPLPTSRTTQPSPISRGSNGPINNGILNTFRRHQTTILEKSRNSKLKLRIEIALGVRSRRLSYQGPTSPSDILDCTSPILDPRLPFMSPSARLTTVIPPQPSHHL